MVANDAKIRLWKVILSALCVVLCVPIQAQGRLDSLLRYVEIGGSLQLWGVYSQGVGLDEDGDGIAEQVPDRMGFMFRRARLQVRVQPSNRLQLQTSLMFDQVGNDKYSAVRGGDNAARSVNILDAFLHYKLLKDSQALFVTAGYFRPQFHRECITSAFSLGSIEKSLTQNYARKHLANGPNGRTMGVTLGGMRLWQGGGITYQLGMHDTRFAKDGGASRHWSPLLISRVVWHLGQPEQQQYTINYRQNFFGQRKGLSVGLAGAHQDKTDLFDRHEAYTADFLGNWGGWLLNGEYTWLLEQRGEQHYTSRQAQLRTGYTWLLSSGHAIEPTALWAKYWGEGTYTGTDSQVDVGVNAYSRNHLLRIYVHWVWQRAQGKNLATVASGIARIPGDYLGTGVSWQF